MAPDLVDWRTARQQAGPRSRFVGTAPTTWFESRAARVWVDYSVDRLVAGFDQPRSRRSVRPGDEANGPGSRMPVCRSFEDPAADAPE
jgi:hypothetical protein